MATNQEHLKEVWQLDEEIFCLVLFPAGSDTIVIIQLTKDEVERGYAVRRPHGH